MGNIYFESARSVLSMLRMNISLYVKLRSTEEIDDNWRHCDL